MKKITIKNMIENSEIPASLIRSTIKQFGGFESFRESAPDVSNHGIAGGFNGFIYYSDTCDFFKRNKEYKIVPIIIITNPVLPINIIDIKIKAKKIIFIKYFFL